jgi:hypothetical protein
MIGTGITWLLLESRSVRSVEARLVERGRAALGTMGEAIANAAETTRDALGGVTSSVGRSVGSAAGSILEGANAIGHYAQSGASAVAGGVRGAASTLGDKAQGGYRHGRDFGSDFWGRHPLATSAAILTAGLAAGLLLPSTRRESRMMGPASKGMAQTIRSKGGELLERGRQLAVSAVRGESGTADERSTTPGQHGRRRSKSRSSRNRRRGATSE